MRLQSLVTNMLISPSFPNILADSDMKFSRFILFVLLFVFCLSAVHYPFVLCSNCLFRPRFPSPIPVRAEETEVEVEPAETDDIDDILEANVDEPEEADDDVSYEGEEETPVIMKSLKFPVHPLTDIPSPLRISR